MAMAGGNLSALLVDLTGLQFGKALLSALGVPQQTEVQCFVGDLALQRGMLNFKALTLDTGEAITNVGGDLNLSKETIDLALKTDSKHFSVGSLPTNIHIGGTFKDPSIRPGAEVAARARCGGRPCGGVPAAGNPADHSVRHVRCGRCSLRGTTQAGSRGRRWGRITGAPSTEQHHPDLRWAKRRRLRGTRGLATHIDWQGVASSSLPWLPENVVSKGHRREPMAFYETAANTRCCLASLKPG